MKPINVGLLGVGTVGGGTATVLKRNAAEISRRAGRDIVLKMAANLDLDAARAIVGDGVDVVADGFAVARHPDIDIVVELIGGTGIAKELVLAAIDSGKHVVTANKKLLAEHGNEIFARAQEKGVTVAFEAAVAGGIPIIKALREGLTANRIEWVAGIINGTTNYILTQMRERGVTFAQALTEAQQLGYAEADPTFDVEGIDAAHKATLMASIAFGVPIQFERAYVEGITRIEPRDVAYAEELGYRLKLLGIAKRREGGFELRVHPTLVPADHLLANVNGAMNAVLVKGDAVGQTMFYGKGAGAEPTASAVIADLVDVTRLHTADPEHRVPHLAFQPDQVREVAALPIEECRTASYLRLAVADRPGVLAEITRVLAAEEISIAAMIQKAPACGRAEIVMTTHEACEAAMNRAIAAIETLPAVQGAVTRLRIEPLAD